ncbi:MAG: methyltransferase [Xanthobacteraceae bacterium]|jgi:demethylspheroidene O-methyltransferase
MAGLPGGGVAVHAAHSQPDQTWLDRCRAARDRLLASPKFRRWAASFRPTRPIARRRARALFDLCAGFVYSQVLLACIRLRVFDILSEGPLTVAALAQRLALPVDATRRLMAAAASLRLVEARGRDRFGLGPLGSAMVGNPAVAAMVEHHTHFYADLADPVALLRGELPDTRLGRYWPYAGAARPAELTRDQVQPYTELMSASQALIADEVIDAYPIGDHRRLLDVGGGDGAFVTAVARRAPALPMILFDLPPVAEQARARLAALGLADRVAAVGGDFLSDPLPDGADLVTLVRVIHDHDDAAALAILRAVRRALPPDGVVLVAEPMSGIKGAEPAEAYFELYLLAMGRGRPRTAGDIARLLAAAGFGGVQQVPTCQPLLTSLIAARPKKC